MVKLKDIINDIPQPEYNDITIIKNQSTSDIINEILKSHSLYGDQGNKIAPHFKGSDTQIINDLFKFMDQELIYKIEPDTYQSSKAPNRIIWDTWDGKGIDCKGYSLFASAILNAKGIPYKFRFVSYNPFNKEPHHVYVIAKVKNKWVHIDPLQKSPKFSEKLFMFVKDKNPIMALKRLSGIGNFQQALLKPITWVSRNAFLLIVKKNVANIGGKLVKGYQKDSYGTLNWWKNLGGSTSSLIKAMNKVPSQAIQYTGVQPPPVYLYNPMRANPERADFCRAKYPAKISLNRGACTRGIIRGNVGGIDPSTQALLVAGAGVVASLLQFLNSIGIGTGTQIKEVEDYVKDISTNDIAPTTAGVPLPLLLIAGGLLASFLLFPKK